MIQSARQCTAIVDDGSAPLMFSGRVRDGGRRCFVKLLEDREVRQQIQADSLCDLLGSPTWSRQLLAAFESARWLDPVGVPSQRALETVGTKMRRDPPDRLLPQTDQLAAVEQGAPVTTALAGFDPVRYGWIDAIG